MAELFLFFTFTLFADMIKVLNLNTLINMNHIRTLSEFNGIRTYNHIFRKRTLKHLVKLANIFGVLTACFCHVTYAYSRNLYSEIV